MVASSPLVPQNDPTLMFTNAGMVQFKNVLLALNNADISGRYHRKNVCAAGANIMILKMWVTPHGIKLFEMLGNFFWRLFQGPCHRDGMAFGDKRAWLKSVKITCYRLF